MTPSSPQPAERFYPKRLLVTGGAGFIGCHFIRFVIRRRSDVEIVNLDALTYAGHLENLTDVADHPTYTFIQGDIADRATVRRAMEGCDAVVNIAAETHVDRSILDNGPFVRTNVLGTQVLLDCAREIGVKRFVQVSTDEVYGSLPLDDPNRFDESSPLRPNSPYAASKAAGDLLVLAYARTFGFPGIVTRSTNNFGPYQFPEKVIPLFITKLLAGEKAPLYGDGLHVRDWMHVADHAGAVLTVLEGGRAGRVYNIGADNERSNLELARLLARFAGRDASLIEHVDDRPGHDRRYAVDASRIRRELNWRPTESRWPEALARAVEWYRANQRWCDAVRAAAEARSPSAR